MMNEYKILKYHNDALIRHNNKEITSRIDSENNEISNRILWATVSQGFLFNALKSGDPIISNIIIPIVGMLISLATIWGVARAFSGRSKYIRWYRSRQEPCFPPVIGRLPDDNVFVSPNIFLPLGICFFWMIILWIKTNCIVGSIAFVISLFLFYLVRVEYENDVNKH